MTSKAYSRSTKVSVVSVVVAEPAGVVAAVVAEEVVAVELDGFRG